MDYFMRLIVIVVIATSLCCCDAEKEVAYYENGKIKSISEMKNGEPEGGKKSFYPSGELEFTAHYKHGTLDGLVEYFYETGKLKSRANWKNGKEDGKSIVYYENGSKLFEAEYASGKVKGYSKVFFDTGGLKELKLYDSAGDICYIKLFDEAGKLKDRFVLPKVKANKDTVDAGEEFYVKISYGLKISGRIRIVASQMDSLGNIANDSNIFESEGSEAIIYRHTMSSPGRYKMIFRFQHDGEIQGDTLSVNGVQSECQIVVLNRRVIKS